MQRAYLASSRLLSLLLVVVGAVIVVSALARGGGPAALGTVIGSCFVVAGSLRLWVARSAGTRSSRQ